MGLADLERSQFVLWKWLVFRDNNDQNCFKTHTRKQVVGCAVNSNKTKRHVEYAEIIQKGTWD